MPRSILGKTWWGGQSWPQPPFRRLLQPCTTNRLNLCARRWRAGFRPRGTSAPLFGSEADASRGLKPACQRPKPAGKPAAARIGRPTDSKIGKFENFRLLQTLLVTVLGATLASCGSQTAGASSSPQAGATREVGVVAVTRKNLQSTLVVSSELVPFQQIDVYAKEAGFVKQLNVDYGTHVKAGQVLAVLEIPELQLQLEEDQAAINDAQGQVEQAGKELDRVQAQHNVTHLEFTRIEGVAKSRPGLVAQQEVDDWRAKDLASEAQVESARSALASAQSQLARSQARLRRDQALFDYSKITAPFDGVITQRYANLGTLMQAATSSTQALPLVQLSQDDLFRLVIPVSESYVRFIRVGDPVQVKIPSLNRSFPGKVARFSVDVAADTRTMHTEVDVPNPNRILVPGVYAEATITLERKTRVLAAPQEAINIEGDHRSVWVADPSGHIHQRAVTTGMETPDDVEIVSGLSDGDMVAVGDRSSLREGEPVRPKPITLIQP